MKIVIDIPDEYYKFIKDLHYYNSGRRSGKTIERNVINAIKNGTPYEERPTGKWIIDGHHYKCSRCGKTLAIMFSETDDDDLIGCPFCLADMRKGVL